MEANSELYRVFHQGVKGTRKLYPVNKIMDIAASEIEKKPDLDYYESIYIYDSKAAEQLKNTKSLAGIRDIKIDRLVWDFDSKNLEEALQDTKNLVDYLLSNFNEQNIRVSFSGNKGFHVEVHLDRTLTRKEFEAIVFDAGQELPTFDQRIKDEQRLFRFPLTKNTKTGLYKIPLSLDELNLSVEEIKGLASEDNIDWGLRMDLLDSYGVESLPQNLIELAENANKTPEKKTEVVVGDVPDLSRRPKHLTPAKYTLQEGFFEEGERNEACMILASTYKYLGYNKETTYNIIKATLRLRAERLGLKDYDKQELWNTIIEPIYSPTWKGGTFSEEDGLLKRTIERYDLKSAVDVEDVSLVDLHSLSNQFLDFATNIEANTIKLGIDEIDKKLRITTSSLVAFLAAPSAGKSSVSFGILNTVSKSGEKAIFFSMDMSIPQVYQRIIQRHTGHDEDRIMKNYQNKIVGEIENYQNVLNEEYENVSFVFRSGMTAKEVRNTILQHEALKGVRPRLAILDYLECMRAEGISDSTQSKAQISTELKGIANELGICIILLVQPRMMAGGPAGELNSYTDIKGSSVISEAAAQVITMSRPGFSPKNPEDDNYVTINVVKNRMGKLSSTDLHWNGLTGHIRSLSHEEEKDLKALRAEIARQSKDTDDGDLY